MNQISWLDPYQLTFPQPSEALQDPNGLLAAGGDLTPERLLLAYRSGIFPWYEEAQPILWWSPNPRTVLFPEDLYISRSLHKRLRAGEFDVRLDTDFAAVVERCSEPRDDTEGTWITSDMKRAYLRMYRLGYAHSIETWKGDRLVGGLYGVGIGRMFFGESMFHLVSDASKVALAYLCRLMIQNGCPLIDCQVENSHLLSMGATAIPREEFERYLGQYCDADDGQSIPWADLPSRLGPW